MLIELGYPEPEQEKMLLADSDQHGGETEDRLARLARHVIDARHQGLSFGLR
jgi:hypothetical protein